MDEDYYALSKLARTVFGTNDLDHRRDEGAGFAEEMIASRAARADAVTYDDVERAKVIVVAGLDAEQEVPILHLRLRKAARRGAKIFVLHPRRPGCAMSPSTSCAGRARSRTSSGVDGAEIEDSAASRREPMDR